MPLTVALVAEGDANTADCWSGSARRFVEALRAEGVRVDVYDAELRNWSRGLAAALTFHPVKTRWRQRFLLGPVGFRIRSSRMSRALAASGVRYDAVIQIGATFRIDDATRANVPYVLYCDGNVAIARRGAPFSGASKLQESEYQAVAAREHTVYEKTDCIWTMSEALAKSFREDFNRPSGKVHAIFAGPNNPPTPARKDESGPPSVLFVGKDHERKGSAVLLEAFRRVREIVPNAELHMVGGKPPGGDQPGVHLHGVLSRSTETGRETLDRLWGNATVFCLPSRHEPFGVAFLEAMLAGLPCIGTRRWAMPEIIVDRETGWLVDDGSVDELTAALVDALQDPARSARYGEKGRERVLSQFTWQHVAKRAIGDLERLRA
ncbi:MAG TPA: glycosyltransferase family 4 protein [Gemmatimonadaceae bacterium]